jgi:hypothetical protein
MKVGPILVLVALLGGFCSCQAAAEDIVVVARPTKLKFVMPAGDLPENQIPGTVVFGGVYRTILVMQEVLHGSLSQKSLTVELVATSEGTLAKARPIVVLLSRNEKGELKATWWNDLQTIACLPKRAVIEGELEKSFPLDLSASDERCQFTK